MSLNIFCDKHHSGLSESLVMLFEKRLGHQIFFPIGEEWFKEGYWKLAEAYHNHPATIKQFLSLDNTFVSTETMQSMSKIVNEVPEYYLVEDTHHNSIHKHITLEQFKKMPIDIVIASLPCHVEPYKKLIKEFHPSAKFIFQMGNMFNEITGNLHDIPNLLASTISFSVPNTCNAVFYHQEFNLDIFKPTGVKPEKKIVSFLIDLPKTGHGNLFYVMKSIMSEYEFKSYGPGCDDGTITGVQNIANIINSAYFIFQAKWQGDGFGHCYSEDTEILTNNGWKLFKDLNRDDLVASLTENKELIFEKPVQYVVKDYDGKMLQFKSKNIDFLVTPEHRMFIERYNKWAKSKGWSFVEAKELNFMKPYYPGRAIGFLKAPDVWKGKATVSINWAKFLGWYLSEGCTWIDKKTGWYHRVIIANTNTNNLKEISEIVKSLDFHPQLMKKKGKEWGVLITSKELYLKVKKFGLSSEKYIPEEILEGNKEILKAFLDCILKGDGHKETKNLYRLTTTSKKLADGFQEIAIKLGYRTSLVKSNWKTQANKEVFRVNISNVRKIKKCYLIPEEINYKGTVYCVSVPSGIILVRRNGQATFNGNCLYNAFACGKPILTCFRDYKDKLGFELMRDMETCIDFDQHNLEEVCQILRNLTPEKYQFMSQQCYNKFKEKVNYDTEEIKIKRFLENLK